MDLTLCFPALAWLMLLTANSWFGFPVFWFLKYHFDFGLEFVFCALFGSCVPEDDPQWFSCYLCGFLGTNWSGIQVLGRLFGLTLLLSPISVKGSFDNILCFLIPGGLFGLVWWLSAILWVLPYEIIPWCWICKLDGSKCLAHRFSASGQDLIVDNRQAACVQLPSKYNQKLDVRSGFCCVWSSKVAQTSSQMISRSWIHLDRLSVHSYIITHWQARAKTDDGVTSLTTK